MYLLQLSLCVTPSRDDQGTRHVLYAHPLLFACPVGGGGRSTENLPPHSHARSTSRRRRRLLVDSSEPVVAVGASGGGIPIDVRQPSLGITFAIGTAGVYVRAATGVIVQNSGN